MQGMLATMWYRIVLSCHLLGSSPPPTINGHLSLMLADKQNLLQRLLEESI